MSGTAIGMNTIKQRRLNSSLKAIPVFTSATAYPGYRTKEYRLAP